MVDTLIKIPEELGIIPIKGGVIFPDQVVPLIIHTQKLAKLIDEILTTNKLAGALTQRNPDIEEPKPHEVFDIGCVIQITKMLRFPDGTIRLLIKGLKRFRVTEFTQDQPYLKAKINIVTTKYKKTVALEAMMRNVVTMFQHLVSLAPYLPDEYAAVILNMESADNLIDFVTSTINFDYHEKQALLETTEPKERFAKLIPMLQKEISILELGAKIRSDVKSELDKGQREFYLREQLKAIQKELGETDEHAREIDELRKKILEARMPKETNKVALKELDRLAKMPPHAAEYTVSRTYIDWLISLPWSLSTQDNMNIKRAQKILDEDHYDLEKVKERILEYLAVKKLKPDSKGTILCFIGPPGVGKTSLGKSIARALGRKFIRISLGGIRDEAEIRGHRRTYVGALPGRIIQSVKNCGTNNPVFMLDEIDKVGTDFRGDPSSALLEVLDPEQNNAFSDHYLEVPFDLSRVMFIATGNIIDPIIPALKDRMEMIELPGYILEEKLEIAKKYLIPRQIQENGLKSKNILFDDAAVKRIISAYTKEAGVRNLERLIGSICRKVAKRIAEGKRGKVKLSAKKLTQFLGPQKIVPEVAARDGQIGVATGLAWTPYGGEILFIETLKTRGKKGLILTGLLGDVMKESCQAALSYLKTRMRGWGIALSDLENQELHIHIPSGAIPKDGPSAGLAVVMSLASLIRNKSIDSKIAFSGEITLAGRVLPVGGIKEKVIAAKRAGIEKIMLPKENEKDLQEIPKHVRAGLSFIFASRIDQALNNIFHNKKHKVKK
ncbi:peptidase [candidate division WOR_3 bacterium SM23_42]|uniref:Lon protease n=1 Tax=candidate division WOR_3 bacterium SM23_42 TaxID=1703779 RepID=A0A0S8FUN5_UNCW3|nr:MAG: peptidase [candidate division WOR_3 bacterium SM23_42]